MAEISLQVPLASQVVNARDDEAKARETALRMEASFLSEMLKSAGFDGQANSLSGSDAEEQFASFRREAIAEHMVQAGGIGLTEMFFKAMMEAGHGRANT